MGCSGELGRAGSALCTSAVEDTAPDTEVEPGPVVACGPEYQLMLTVPTVGMLLPFDNP